MGNISFLSSYERIRIRIQKIITDPMMQKIQAVTVRRCCYESEDDWARLIDEIRTTDGVTVIPNEDGSVTIGWKAYFDA